MSHCTYIAIPEKQVSEEAASLFSIVSYVNVTKIPEQEALKRHKPVFHLLLVLLLSYQSRKSLKRLEEPKSCQCMLSHCDTREGNL